MRSSILGFSRIPLFLGSCLLLGGLVLGTSMFSTSKKAASADREIPVLSSPEAEGPYSIETLYDEGGLRVEHWSPKEEFEDEVVVFFAGEEEVFRADAPEVCLGSSHLQIVGGGILLTQGRDLDGNGHPDFLLETNTGGRMCCVEYIWLEWQGDKLIQRDHLFTGVAPIHTAQDLTGDGRPEIILRDVQFLYWRASRADSKAKDVVMVFTEDGLRVSRELMAAPMMPESELAETARELRDEIRRLALEGEPEESRRLAAMLSSRHQLKRAVDERNEDAVIEIMFAQHAPDDEEDEWEYPANWVETPPSLLWDVMLELIYTGHEDRAYQFFEEAWPEEAQGKRAFLEDFQETLSHGLIVQRALP